MRIYLSMILWIMLVAFFAFLTGSGILITENGYKVRKSIAVFTMFYIIFWVGMRSFVGDTSAYIQMFWELPDTFTTTFFSDYQKDRGFFFLSFLFKKYISSQYNAWLFVIALICGLCVVITLYRYSVNFFFSMYLFMTMLHFVWMVNGMRQFIVVTILFYNINFLVKRQIIPYIILTLLLATVHITALIMIPAYFVAIFKPWSIPFWGTVAGALAIGLSIDRIADYFSYVLEDSVYEGYLEVAANSAGANILRVAVALAPVILAYVSRKHTAYADDAVINICVNFSVISAILYYCATRAGGVLIGRLPIFFDIYNLLLIPWLLNHAFESNSRRIIYLLTGLAYFLFFFYKTQYGMHLSYGSSILGIQY